MFDPYHKWLGIPPAEQPPDHYRLLGLARGESDLDVIEHAANGRMAFLRTLQNGPHFRESQELLNEVARARDCLLRPVSKEVYDAGLNGPAAPAAVSPAEPLPSPHLDFVRRPVLEFAPAPAPAAPSAAPALALASPRPAARPLRAVLSPTRSRVSSKNHAVPIVGGGLVGIGLGYLIVTHVLGLSFFVPEPAAVAPASPQIVAPQRPPAPARPVSQKPAAKTVQRQIHPITPKVKSPFREVPAPPIAAEVKPAPIDDAAVSRAIGIPLEVQGQEPAPPKKRTN